jgi:anti-sigma factor RsiW
MNKHVNQQLSDYVLNLLPRLERQAVEQHTAVCVPCQKALQAEREMSQMVRYTLNTATQPANGRLAHLMPAIPTARKQSAVTMFVGWQRQLAVAGLLFVILFGSLGVWNGRSSHIWGVASPTALAATATRTQDATATIAQQTSEAQETLTTTAVASPTLPASSRATPAPQATPIAAIPARIATN